MIVWYVIQEDELYHHGILGQKWGVRRFQNPDGSLTNSGRKRYTAEERARKKADNATWIADEKHAHGQISDKKHERLTEKAMRQEGRVLNKYKYVDAKYAWKDRTKDTKKGLYANKVAAKANYKDSKKNNQKSGQKAAAKVYAKAMLKKKYTEVVTDKAIVERGTEFTAKAIRKSQKIAAVRGGVVGYIVGAGSAPSNVYHY